MEKLGVTPHVSIRAKDGLQLYPPPAQGPADPSQESILSSLQGAAGSAEIAARNLELLQHHFVLGIDVRIERDSWLATGILAFYVFSFSGLLLSLYIQRAKKATAQEGQYQAALAQAQDEVRNAYAEVQKFQEKEAEFTRDLLRLQHELEDKGQELQGTEEEALQEMEELERKLKQSEALRGAKERELLRLKKEAQDLHVNQVQPALPAKKKTRNVGKRLAALYPSLHFDARAIDGLSALSEDMQIRAEKCFAILEQDSRKLQIKRKVFTKKGNMAVFESEFAYCGRMYWRQKKSGKIQVFAIGTKNSQDSDLKYINSLSCD
ncbi:MAG: hypothetical protein ACQESV_08090 [Thermodesulfobacteriota bacterium]